MPNNSSQPPRRVNLRESFKVPAHPPLAETQAGTIPGNEFTSEEINTRLMLVESAVSRPPVQQRPPIILNYMATGRPAEQNSRRRVWPYLAAGILGVAGFAAYQHKDEIITAWHEGGTPAIPVPIDESVTTDATSDCVTAPKTIDSKVYNSELTVCFGPTGREVWVQSVAGNPEERARQYAVQIFRESNVPLSQAAVEASLTGPNGEVDLGQLEYVFGRGDIGSGLIALYLADENAQLSELEVNGGDVILRIGQ